MKGHMQDGKFHPHTQYKGVRKARDRSAKTEGIRLKRNRSYQEIKQNHEKQFKGWSGQLDPLDIATDEEIEEFMKDVEKRWKLIRETHGGTEGDGFSLVYENIDSPSTTFEIHPMDDNEEEDENGKQLEEPRYYNAWYWFPAFNERGIPNSPSIYSEQGGYTQKDALKQFQKDLINYDRGFN